jgi:hypothetical protein
LASIRWHGFFLRVPALWAGNNRFEHDFCDQKGNS